jgi:hypothetical protein
MSNQPIEKVLSIKELLSLISEISIAGGGALGSSLEHGAAKDDYTKKEKSKKKKYKLEEIVVMADNCLKEDKENE